MIALIDNYDSFVHNLARYLDRLGQHTRVFRNDAVDVATLRALSPQAIVVSPGPCSPNEAGVSVQVIQDFYQTTPILGVCLGHQAIGAAFGGKVVRSVAPMHGRVSEIAHDGRGVFEDLPNPLTACRYHSLVVDEESLPPELTVSARSPDGEVMAVTHTDYPTIGVQFHPESILTESGYRLLANFLEITGCPVTLPAELELLERPRRDNPTTAIVFDHPVTF